MSDSRSIFCKVHHHHTIQQWKKEGGEELDRNTYLLEGSHLRRGLTKVKHVIHTLYNYICQIQWRKRKICQQEIIKVLQLCFSALDWLLFIWSWNWSQNRSPSISSKAFNNMFSIKLLSSQNKQGWKGALTLLAFKRKSFQQTSCSV